MQCLRIWIGPFHPKHSQQLIRGDSSKRCPVQLKSLWCQHLLWSSRHSDTMKISQMSSFWNGRTVHPQRFRISPMAPQQALAYSLSRILFLPSTVGPVTIIMAPPSSNQIIWILTSLWSQHKRIQWAVPSHPTSCKCNRWSQRLRTTKRMGSSTLLTHRSRSLSGGLVSSTGARPRLWARQPRASIQVVEDSPLATTVHRYIRQSSRKTRVSNNRILKERRRELLLEGKEESERDRMVKREG